MVEIKSKIKYKENREKNCPECRNWRYTRTNHWCSKDSNRYTYTSMDIWGKAKLGKCNDFEYFRCTNNRGIR